jgi:hypothetical protein
MEGETVLYDGRIVPKQGFRVFIYGFDGQTKLVESWEEYQENISSGVWFSHADNPKLSKISPDVDKSPNIDSRKDKKRSRD